MNDAQPRAEAVAVKDGKILAVGTRAGVEKAHKGATTKAVDLRGRTIPMKINTIQVLETIEEGATVYER